MLRHLYLSCVTSAMRLKRKLKKLSEAFAIEIWLQFTRVRVSQLLLKTAVLVTNVFVRL